MNEINRQTGEEVTTLVVAGEVVPDQLVVRREPMTILAEARKSADALMQVIAGKKKRVEFNGEQYIENEDWQVIARFYGCTIKIEGDAYVSYGDVAGFEAVAVLIGPDGRELSRAMAMCLNDEEKWGSRNKYGWAYVLKDGSTTIDEPDQPFKVCELEPTGKEREDGSLIMRPKKVKQLIGTESVPLFQLRSMAQTRASSKVARQVFAFVPVLAGFRPTPAEELDGMAHHVDAEAVSVSTPNPSRTRQQGNAGQTRTQNGRAQGQTQQGTTRPAQSGGQAGGKTISAAQVKRLWAIVRDVGANQDQVADALLQKYGLDSSEKIPMSQYDKIIDEIKAGTLVVAPDPDAPDAEMELE